MNGRGEKRLILAEKRVTARRGEQRVEEHFQDRRDFSIFIGERDQQRMRFLNYAFVFKLSIWKATHDVSWGKKSCRIGILCHLK